MSTTYKVFEENVSLKKYFYMKRFSPSFSKSFAIKIESLLKLLINNIL